MKRIWIRLLTGAFLIAWMTVIFCFSSQPAEESSEISGTVTYRLVSTTDKVLRMELSEPQILEYTVKLENPVRKAAHMTEYAILGLFAFLFCGTFTKRMRRVYPASLMIAFCYACTDELHQVFVPGRAGQFRDVCIDTAGALIILTLLCFVQKKIRKHCEKRRLPLQ